MCLLALPVAVLGGLVSVFDGRAEQAAAVALGLVGLARTGRAAAGIFITQFVFALVWAYAGYRLARRSP